MIDNSKLNINTPLKIKKYKGSLMNIPSYMKISQFIQNILGEGECKHKDRETYLMVQNSLGGGGVDTWMDRHGTINLPLQNTFVD